MPDVRRPLLAASAAALAALGAGACASGGGTTTATSVGARVYAESGCGSCHVFAPAGSTGSAGPSLDDAQLTPAAAAAVVRRGAAGMPAFDKGLTDAEILAVARFVAGD